MATKKPRKRAYVPPPSEVENRKERDARPRTRTMKSNGQAGPDYYTLPNGRRMRVPPEPSFARVLKQLPIYFLIMVAFYYFIPANGASANQRLFAGVVNGALICVVMLPMLVWMDKRRYNTFLKLSGRTPDRGGAAAKRRATAGGDAGDVVEGAVVDDDEA